ncbi:MAG: prepilin peptidase [Hyphomicrobiales bacterium]|nr:prepilin peptidase [Hyphomicrobiales bacterium]OQW84668.1 MAG: peptidase [Proteobacteria bacterium ST_bin15]
MTSTVLILLFPAAMAFAAASDLVTMTIPNRLQLLVIAGFFLSAVLVGMDAPTIGLHVLAAFAVLAGSFAFFSFGWIGGGDGKLAAATALWFGFSQNLIDYLVMSAFYGGLLTIGLLIIRAQPIPLIIPSQPWMTRLLDQQTGIPYGIALALAGLSVYASSPWMTLALALR